LLVRRFRFYFAGSKTFWRNHVRIEAKKSLLAQLLLLRGAKQLLTLRGPSGVRRGAALNDLGIIEDGSILIQDRRILSVGPTRRIENLKESRGAIDIPVTGCVVMPGFVDPAIHVSLYENQLPGEASAKRKKALKFFEESQLLIRSCLQHGTLNAQFKVYSDAGSPAADVVALRQLASIGSVPVATLRSLRLADSAFAEGRLVALAERLALLKRRRFVQSLELAAGQQTWGTAFWDVLRKAEIPLNLVWQGGPVELLRYFLEHARPRSVFCPAELSVAEFSTLAHSASIAVFSPCKELLEERENPSAKKLLDAGGAIALASGYDSKDAPIFSMQMVLALAVLRLRLSAEQAIAATTINAAHALGCGHEVGSLEAGKRADILVLSLSDYREIPRRIGVNQVLMALRDGNFLINRRRAKASA
jgi:imidazolonepropionase